MRHLVKSGQSLPEYGVIFGLVILIALGAVSGLGGQVSTLLGTTVTGLFGGGGGGGVATATPKASMNNLLGLVSPPAKPGGANGSTTAGSGQTMSGGSGGEGLLPLAGQFSSQSSSTTSVDGIAKAIGKAGLTGATGKYASKLEDLADRLEDSGKLTPTQAQAIRDIANKGHEIAHIQELIANGIKRANNDPVAINNTKITYNGQTYSLVDFSYLNFDFNSLRQGKGGILDASTQAVGSSLIELSNLYKTALASGALADPKVQALVEKSVTNISLISEQVEDTTRALERCAQGTCSLSSVRSGTFDLDTHVASQLTQNESQTICTAGDGTGVTSCVAK